jgi:hypothetical protein
MVILGEDSVVCWDLGKTVGNVESREKTKKIENEKK